jgi:hypothetical protein
MCSCQSTTCHATRVRFSTIECAKLPKLHAATVRHDHLCHHHHWPAPSAPRSHQPHANTHAHVHAHAHAHAHAHDHDHDHDVDTITATITARRVQSLTSGGTLRPTQCASALPRKSVKSVILPASISTQEQQQQKQQKQQQKQRQQQQARAATEC